jgi:toxin YoeB
MNFLMNLELIIKDNGFEDLLFWANNDKKILTKILKLIENCKKTPFEGLGKPEPLKHEYKGYWSRRIDSEHRLIYKVEDNFLIIIQCRYHY